MDFDYSAYYNSIAGSNEALTRLASGRYVEILQPYLPQDKTAQILEIGPGNGLTLKYLADLGYSALSGLEVDKNLAQAAIGAGLNVTYIPQHELIEAVAAQKKCFDLVFCMHVLEHVPTDEQLLFICTVGESLSSRGFFVCETPNALSATANYFRYNDWTHSGIFTPASLRFLFQAGGLEVVYAGASRLRVTPPRGGAAISALKFIAERILRGVSAAIMRIHYVAEFGMPGFDMPLTSSLLIVGKQPESETII